MAIEVKSVSFSVGGRHILRDISLNISEPTVILGKNGAGKTTLLRLISGILTPTLGDVLIDGKILTSRKLWASSVAYQPQSLEIVFPIKVHDLLKLSGFCRGSTENFDEVVQLLCLENLLGQDARTLSGGELRRVMLAGALIQGARYVLFDEPTAFLDPFQEEIFVKSLLHLENRMVPIITTHNLSLVDRLKTKTVKLKSGSLYDGDALYE